MPPFDGNPQEIEKELKRIGDEVKNFGEDAMKQVKATGDMTTELKGKVDAALLEQGEMLQKQAELVARLEEVEQKSARRQANAEGEQKTIGQQFVEQEGFKEFVAKKGRGSFSMNTKAVLTSATSSSAGSVGDAVRADRVPGILPGVERRMTVRDLITPGRTGSNAIEYVKETGFTNSAAVAAENTTKAASDLTFDLVTQSVVTIAHYVRASKQILDDVAQLESYIDGRLRYGLAYVEEAQLLNGSGSGGNINGIYTQATAYSQPAGAFTGTPTPIDILRLALLQAELAEFPSTGIVLNPIQWAAIELLKDDVGRYIIGNPQGSISASLWNRPVVSTQAMTTDKFLVGSFKLGAQVFDREDANVLVSTEDQDNFIKNLVTIRAEERLALAVYRPEGFIKGDLGLVS